MSFFLDSQDTQPEEESYSDSTPLSSPSFYGGPEDLYPPVFPVVPLDNNLVLLPDSRYFREVMTDYGVNPVTDHGLCMFHLRDAARLLDLLHGTACACALVVHCGTASPRTDQTPFAQASRLLEDYASLP
jgi:hypothetical protein